MFTHEAALAVRHERLFGVLGIYSDRTVSVPSYFEGY